jgi:catechol 2,3-dioxygenase-like lactoylglutathione lyase family enzyme
MATFYRRLLNLEPIAESDGLTIFLVGGTKLFIHRAYSPGEGDPAPENHVAFAVPDVDAVYSELIAGGLAVEIAPRNYYWGRSAYLRDPDGHLIELAQAD